MPSQRVVVLTDEEIRATRRVLSLVEIRSGERETEILNSAYDKLGFCLERPGGITKDMVDRAVTAAKKSEQGGGLHGQFLPTRTQTIRSILEAALFPGEDER